MSNFLLSKTNIIRRFSVYEYLNILTIFYLKILRNVPLYEYDIK